MTMTRDDKIGAPRTWLGLDLLGFRARRVSRRRGDAMSMSLMIEHHDFPSKTATSRHALSTK